MELYTSLTRLKQEIEGGALPPMTPVPRSAHHLIDPALTIGQGALEEDAVRGLRCPVRDCGEYHGNLTKHINRAHREQGGAPSVKAALDIPPTVRLVASATRERMSGAARRVIAKEGAAARVARTANPSPRKTVAPFDEMMGYRNLRNRCEAQLREKLLTLQTTLGRSPSISDTKTAFGEGIVAMMKRVYGTWDNAKAQLGLPLCSTGRPSPPRDAVLRGLRAFYDLHDRFPTRTEADRPRRVPLVCCAATTLNALGAESWSAGMHTAAIELGLYRAPSARSA